MFVPDEHALRLPKYGFGGRRRSPAPSLLTRRPPFASLFRYLPTTSLRSGPAMRLLLPSLFIAAYVFLSLARPIPCRRLWKTAFGLTILAISQKYLFYQFVGGSFFKPALPISLLVTAEALYASLVVLFFAAVLKDIAGLLFWFARRAGLGVHLPLSAGSRCALLVTISLLAGIWGSFQAIRVPDIHTVEIRIPGLPPALDGVSLVQLSDIHIGPMLKRPWLERVVDRTNAADPDIIVITGDVIDGLPQELASEVEPLSRLRAKDGVFGVTGNHECYYDASGWKKTFRAMGIQMLENEHHVTSRGLILGGIPDRTEQRFGGEAPDTSKAFANAPAGPRILLAHQPRDAAALSTEGVQLQLSGHTHGGLLFFLAPLIASFNEGYVCGLYEVGQGQLYVSPGTGLWSGFSCRIGVPSEITRIVLCR